jgi:hypothetical protein
MSMRRKSKKVKFMKSFRFSGQTGDGAYNGFEGALSSSILRPLSAVEAAPCASKSARRRLATAPVASSSKR